MRQMTHQSRQESAQSRRGIQSKSQKSSSDRQCQGPLLWQHRRSRAKACCACRPPSISPQPSPPIHPSGFEDHVAGRARLPAHPLRKIYRCLRWRIMRRLLVRSHHRALHRSRPCPNGPHHGFCVPIQEQTVPRPLPTYSRLTNGRGSDVDGPIPHAKPGRRTHTQEVPHRRAVPHRPDIHQLPLAAALQ
jgi:hypothetical protein